MYTFDKDITTKKYYDEKFLECSNDCKKTYIPNEFVSNEKVFSGSLDIGNGYNDFFSEIGPNLAKQISKSKNHYSSFLSNPCSEGFGFGNIIYYLLLLKRCYKNRQVKQC